MFTLNGGSGEKIARENHVFKTSLDLVGRPFNNTKMPRCQSLFVGECGGCGRGRSVSGTHEHYTGT